MAGRHDPRVKKMLVDPLKVSATATAAVASAQCAIANGSDAATTQALANDLKVKYNAAQLEIVELRAKLDALNAKIASL